MDRRTVIERLRAHGARALFLVGDVDLLFDDDDPHFGLIDQLKLADFVASLLGANVDLATRGGLHPASGSESRPRRRRPSDRRCRVRSTCSMPASGF